MGESVPAEIKSVCKGMEAKTNLVYSENLHVGWDLKPVLYVSIEHFKCVFVSDVKMIL